MRQMHVGVAAAILAGAASVVLASSPDAWQEFRDDVTRKCRDQFQKVLVNPHVVVDRIGVAAVGIAIGTGQSKHSKDRYMYVCIYDKKTKTVELGSEIDLRDIPSCR